MNVQQFVIFVAAAFFLLYGLAFSILPGAMAVLVTGSEPHGVSALVDLRATYGGMTVAVGIALIYLYLIHQVRTCLIVIILVLLSMAISRTMGLVLEGGGNIFMYLYLVLELVGSALAFFSLRGVSSDA